MCVLSGWELGRWDAAEAAEAPGVQYSESEFQSGQILVAARHSVVALRLDRCGVDTTTVTYVRSDHLLLWSHGSFTGSAV